MLRPFIRHVLLAGWLALSAAASMAIEQPGYEVISAQGEFELRHYRVMLIAQTVVEGDREQASRKAFGLLADYIFGNNQLAGQSGASTKIAMTAPVTIEPPASKIAMTAPVALAMSAEGAWRVHFVMPSQYSMATIPKPRNPEVELREVPSRWMIAHRFSGLASLSEVESKTEEALKWARARGLAPAGSPQLARYDPPWTPPMARRNEILIEVAQPSSSAGKP